MPVKPTEKIWHNGKLIDWDDAKIHVMAHVVNYGSSVLKAFDVMNYPPAPQFSARRNTCSACSIPQRFIASLFRIPASNLSMRWWKPSAPTAYGPATSAR